MLCILPPSPEPPLLSNGVNSCWLDDANEPRFRSQKNKYEHSPAGARGGGSNRTLVRPRQVNQTRMKRYARMIYMLSQCKDAIDNPAALFTRMRRRDLSVWGAIRASWKIWTLADIRAALTNQELALAVTSLRAEAENPKQQWRTK